MGLENIKASFQRVKKDIVELKDQILSVAERLERLETSVEESKNLVEIRDSNSIAKRKTPKKK